MVSFILATFVSMAPLREIRDSQHVVTNVNLTEIQKGFEELPKQYRRTSAGQELRAYEDGCVPEEAKGSGPALSTILWRFLLRME